MPLCSRRRKMADSIVHEAEAKRDALLSRAEMDARERIAQLQKETEAVQERLRQGQEELARFIASCREVCAKELHLLEELPELPVETAVPAEAPEAQVEKIEEQVLACLRARGGEGPPSSLRNLSSLRRRRRRIPRRIPLPRRSLWRRPGGSTSAT
mgnify:CR=1 FL=1